MAAIKIKQGEDWVKLPNVGIQSGIADAPVDDVVYGRKNGEWVAVESVPSGETVKITVTSNQAQPDANINGVTITLVYGDDTKEFTWEGTEITTEVPMNVTYTITCSEVEGYATPEVKEYVALATNTRNVSLSYNTTITTITVTSNHPTLFTTAVDVTLGGEFQKTLTGALTYTLKIPTNAEYTVTGSDVLMNTTDYYRQFVTPAVQTVTATGTTQSVNLVYNGTKVTLSITSDEGTINPTVTINPLSWAHVVTSGVSNTFVFASAGNYSFVGSEITNYDTPSTQTIAVDDTYTDKTVTLAYSFLTEEAYAMWVEFDDGASTTSLTRGGNLDVITSLTSKFKRCLALPQDDGTAAITYLSPTNSANFDDDTAVGASITSSDDPRQGYYMVHFPKYYYRCEVSDENKHKLYISEIKINDEYKEERECLIGVFEAYSYNDILYSRPDVGSTGDQTITAFFNLAHANGSNWGLIDYRAHKTIANMFCAKYGNTDINTSNSSIPCSGGSRNYNTAVGDTLLLGNVDGLVNNSSNFLGLEDCYYGKWEFVQGINIVARMWIAYDGGLLVNSDAAALLSAGYTNVREIGTSATSNGYITGIKHGEYADVMPTAVGGSDTTYYADYFYQNPGNRVFLRSGYSVGGSYCGVFCSAASSDSSYASAYYGSRLGFYGNIVIKTKDEFLALSPGYNG